jgi:type II secretory pathway component PulF
MPRYRYSARNESGGQVKGVLEAADRDKALEALGAKNLFPITLALEDGGQKKLFRRRAKPEELIMFTRQLASLGKAGLPILTTLDIIHQQLDDPRWKKLVGRLQEDIIAGNSLSQALNKYPDFFSPVYANFVYAGEQGGVLEDVLDRLADLLTHNLENQRAVKAALAYPKMVLTAMAGAAVVIMTFVTPKFAEIFRATRLELPLPTRIMLGANRGFQDFWPLILAVLIALGFGVFWLLKSERGRIFWDRFKLRLPVFGPLFTGSLLSRFTFVFGLTVESGLPILETLDMSARTVDNRFLDREIARSKREIRDGRPIGEALGGTGVFPPLVIRMISIGERSGNLSRMMKELVSHYDQEMKYTIAAMTRAMEQILTLAMAALVLGLALAVFLPMWDMISLVSN